MRVLILALSLLAAPAMTADQFDLVCHAEVKHSPDGKWRPQDYRYRVDLKAGRWCDGACNGSKQIAEVKDTQLTLVDSQPAFGTSGVPESLWIDRTSGALHYLYAGEIGTYEQRRGTCEVTAFSGFPAVERKF